MDSNERKLSKIFYSTDGLWKGWAAVNKLAKASGVDENKVKNWLEKQALWQLYLPPPRYVPRPHWTVSEPNKVHQADLLFLPHDTIRGKTYRYALVVVDVASRFKDAEALTKKESSGVVKAIEKIYSRQLDWPKTFMVDPGKEFMGEVTRLMERHGVEIQRSEAGNHRAQAFVERANRTLGEMIFSHQYSQEMVTEGRSREWVKRLPALLKAMNSEVTRITGKEPEKAIVLEEVTIRKKEYQRAVGFEEATLKPFLKVRYLLRPGEEEGGERRRATDPIWSTKVFEISKTIVSKDQPVLYFLKEGPLRGFVQEELQVIPEDTEDPLGKTILFP